MRRSWRIERKVRGGVTLAAAVIALSCLTEEVQALDLRTVPERSLLGSWSDAAVPERDCVMVSSSGELLFGWRGENSRTWESSSDVLSRGIEHGDICESGLVYEVIQRPRPARISAESMGVSSEDHFETLLVRIPKFQRGEWLEGTVCKSNRNVCCRCSMMNIDLCSSGSVSCNGCYL